MAFVALAPGVESGSAELQAWAATRVPERAAAPKRVEIVDEIPLTAVGKPYKPELRRRAAEQDRPRRARRDAGTGPRARGAGRRRGRDRGPAPTRRCTRARRALVVPVAMEGSLMAQGRSIPLGVEGTAAPVVGSTLGIKLSDTDQLGGPSVALRRRA